MMTRSRCALVWLAISVAATVVVRWSLGSVPRHLAAATFDELLVGTAALALTGCVAWAWVVSTVVVGQVLRGSRRPLRRPRGVPAWLLRAIAAACGVAVLGSGVAHAETGHRTPSTSVAPALDGLSGLAARSAQTARADDALDGLPFPDRALGADRPATGPAAASGGRRGVRGGVVVVRPGDSLWRISARRLGPGAGAAEVAAETSALYDLNRDVVGPDPDLIHPGDRLRPPRT